MTPLELGPYLLLRKMSQSALCDIYRAGQREGDDVQRVVLLYLFNAPAEDAAWLADTAQAGRRALRGLSSPALGRAVDSGEISGTAYLAYDHISGGNLRELIDRSRRQGPPISVGQALLITDRIAQGLLAAWHHESRVLHGFVVPDLVMLSSEGDVSLLGIEVASRLRRLLGDSRIQQEMGGYLAPEVVPEGQPATTDDVYSLGAILFELLTGAALPQSTRGDVDSYIRDATCAGGGFPVPEPIADLLRSSLAAGAQRCALASWQADLNTQVISGEYQATAFDLALCLHAIFAEELETDTGDLDLDHDLLADPASVVTPDSGGARDFEPIADEEPRPAPEASLVEEIERAAPRRRHRLAIAAGIVAVALASFGGYSYFDSSPPGEPTRQAAGSLGPPRLSAAGVEAEPPTLDRGVEAARTLPVSDGAVPAVPSDSRFAPLEEEIDRRAQELASQRSDLLEASLRREYEQQMEDLRQQVLEARAAAETPASLESTPETSERRLSDEAASDRSPGQPETLAEATDVSFDIPVPLDSDSAGTAPREALSLSRERPEVTSSTESAAGANPEVPETEPVTVPEPVPPLPIARPGVEPAEPTAQPEEPTAQPEEPTAQPEVQPGDLVEPGPNVIPPKISRFVQPAYPIVARRLRKQAEVEVRALVDENGRVLEVEPLGDEAGYGFDQAALEAARKIVWLPATKNGVPVKMWRTVRIAFEP